MRSVTPDSNLYISALLWDGKAERLLEMGLERKVRLFISDAIMELAGGTTGTLETFLAHEKPQLLLLVFQVIDSSTIKD